MREHGQLQHHNDRFERRHRQRDDDGREESAAATMSNDRCSRCTHYRRSQREDTRIRDYHSQQKQMSDLHGRIPNTGRVDMLLACALRRVLVAHAGRTQIVPAV